VSVAWIRDDRALDNAIRLETRRGSAPRIPISKAAALLEVAVNRSNAEEREYIRYRLVLTADEKSIYEQILQPPRLPADRRAYVMRLALTPERFPKANSLRLRVDGETRSGWESVGEIVLLPAGK
jgi:hypothetical protein